MREQFQRLLVLALPADRSAQQTPRDCAFTLERHSVAEMCLRRLEIAQRELHVAEAQMNIEIAAAERKRAREACLGLLISLLRLHDDSEIEVGLRNSR